MTDKQRAYAKDYYQKNRERLIAHALDVYHGRVAATPRPAELPPQKTCVVCGTPKPRGDFHVKGKGRWDSHCKPCRNARDKREWLEALPPDAQEALKSKRAARGVPRAVREKEYSKRLTTKRQRLLDHYKKGKPCMDCGGFFRREVLEFDHRGDAPKVACVSQLITKNVARLEAEIAKCDLVCSNCHRVRTARRRAGLPAILPPPEYEI